jgi:catechol 2,3-dioxygenase-like lactoylglutathione lyase family enzyme
MTLSFSHFGICVSDLEHSVRFYCEGLGFTRAEAHDIGPEFAALMELDDVALRSQFIRREGTAIELLAFSEPAPVGPPVRRAINQLGLTHLSFRVEDLAAHAARIEALGGTVLEKTKTVLDFGGAELQFVYCTDPDGVRIELMDLGPGR